MKPGRLATTGPSDSPHRSDEPDRAQASRRRPDPTAPAAPSRNRLIRPTFYRSSTTGPLEPDVRDLLLALTTVADDDGWLLWNPVELAATIYAYQAPRDRVEDLERRAAELLASGLLDVRDCGCAYLPTLRDQHGIKGGRPGYQIRTWHEAHVGARATTGDHAPDSVSGSVSDSGSLRAPEGNGLERAGLPSTTPEAMAFLEEITGEPWSRAGEKQLGEYDRLIGRHGFASVRAVMETLSDGERMTAAQLVWPARKELEPFANPKQAAAAEDDRKRQARRDRGVLERRLEQFRFTGQWDPAWGPAPEAVPA